MSCHTTLLVALAVVLELSLVSGHGTPEGSRLHDTKITHDKEHIKEHLKDEIDIKDDNLKDEDLQFHYFKMHDYDGNSKLDGLELMNAMTHYHDESDVGNSTETYTDEQMSTMIDQILNEDDTNKDGFIDYPEFIASQKS